jgi:hypothetical protein
MLSTVSVRPPFSLARLGLRSMFVLATSFAVLTPTPSYAQTNSPCADEPSGSETFLRTELYFGSAKPDGTAVTPDEFEQFVDQEITPRFPDGLTLLPGMGQFRDSTGSIEKERSVLLILLYPLDAAGSSSDKIEQIRQTYEYQFQQESVLRVVEPRAQCVSF